MEHWNSVRIKFNVSREAASKLKLLAEQDNEILRNLGILSVQIDNDKLLKLNLTSNELNNELNNKEKTTERNDTLTKLLERQSPSPLNNTINLPFIVNNNNSSNNKILDNNNFIVQQQHPQQQNIYHNQQSNIHQQPSTSHQQNEIIDRQLAFLNQNKNSSIKLNSNEDNLLINRPIQSINNSPICNNIGAASPINQLNQLNQHQNLTKQPLLNKNVQQQPQQQNYSYVNMQQPANQLNKINDKNLINKPNNLINQNIKINNLSNIQPIATTTIPTQNIVQQIQFKPYPLTQQSSLNNSQTNNSNNNNIINIKQSYVRNPNIKLTAAPTVINNQLPNQQQQQSNQQFKPNQLDLNKDQLNNSQSLNQPNSSSNVALTSPLLVNLLQSDVNDHYSSNVNHLSLTNTPISNNSNNNNVNNNNSNLASSSSIKEPPAKKQKTAKTTKRKLKDKPPDQLLQVNTNNNINQIKQPSQQNQLNKTTKLNINSNDIIKVKTVNSTTPSNNIQYHQIDNKQLQFSNSIVNSSIITIPTVTLSSNNLQPINNVSNTYQQTTFIDAQSQQQTNCSYSTNQPIYQISSNNSSTIVNQIKLTNSEIITTSNSNNNQFLQTNNHQLNQINQIEQQSTYSTQITQQQPQLTNSTSLINNNNNLIINKTPINSSSINNSSGYFQKLSSLTNDSTSSSNLIVQNSTIVNTSIINNNFSTTSNPILPHNQTNDSIFNLPSPIEEENKTKHLINPFTGQLEPFTGQFDSFISEDEIDTLTSNSTTNSNNTIINSNLNMTTNTLNNQFDNQNQINKLSSGDLQTNHLSDTDSGISKSTNDASSQSSTELITANDLLNSNQDNHKSLVNFDNESINDNTLLKNKLGINDMLNNGNNDLITNDSNNKLTNNTDSINQQVFMLNNSLDKQKSAIETTTNDQIDDYFNTPELGDYQLTDSLVTDSNATCTTNSTNNLVSSTIPFTDSSSNLLGNDISNHTEELNVNDFLTTPLEQITVNKTADFNSDDKQVTIESDHNYTNSGDHNYTNFKRPCSFTQNTTNNAANICNNKIKKVNS